ncbi:MAG: hypothetical protein A2Y16_03250 [Tenericutes bacterium GWF2_57_13]|nr:MAG: hypothetical protein A2Y16_03250 [Tenericutes bacterium GWF2_57_13]
MDSKALSNVIKNDKDELARRICENDPHFAAATVKYREKYLQDILFTLTFLANALSYDQPSLYKNYMTWFGGFARSHRFSETRFNLAMDAMRAVLADLAAAEHVPALRTCLDLGREAFHAAFQTSDAQEVEIDPFLADLLQMRSEKATRYVVEQYEKGVGIESIYLDILQPTLYKVGALWQRGIIGVAKEHYVTAVIQHIIGQLYPYLFETRKTSRHAMTAVCAGSELHEIGMRMVADFFELAGWDTYFLGSNLPPEMVVEQLKAVPTGVLAISATTPSHLPEVEELVHRIRAEADLCGTKIIVGGRVFNETPELWRQVGADGFATDAKDAIRIARTLIGDDD